MTREVWRFVDLGPRDGYFIQSVYEAVAKFVGSGKRLPTLIFVYPSAPYVCIGVHQLPDLELDVEYCQKKKLPIVRRQVGGGAVYLDPNQQFYQIVLPKNHRLARGTVEDFFRELLKPVVAFYRSYGLPAEYKPINDVVVRGRKASGNGAALLHNAMVLIGNVILDFNAEEAARILRVPEEKMREHLVKTMSEWVTSLKRELGYVPPRNEVVERLKKCFEEELGIELVEDELSEEELEETYRIVAKLESSEWLYGAALGREDLVKRYSPGTRIVKIREGHYLLYVDHRAEKTIRLILEVVDDKIARAIISGDFFVAPHEALDYVAEKLRGLALDRAIEAIHSIFSEAIEKFRASVAGVSSKSLAEALEKAKEIYESSR